MSDRHACSFSGWWKVLVILGLLTGASSRSARQAKSEAQRANLKARATQSEESQLRGELRRLAAKVAALEGRSSTEGDVEDRRPR